MSQECQPIPDPRRRVTLRGLFLSTTYFAVSSALATRFGLGIFVLMNGVFLTWLSFRGYLGWMQTIRARPWTYRTAWLLFVISFGLPALTVRGCNGGAPQTHYGWQTAVMAIAASEGVLEEVGVYARDPSQRTWQKVRELLWGTFSIALWNLPNLMMLASPYLLYLQQRGRGQLLSVLFHCAALSSWSWGIVGSDDLRIGYYVWSSSITAVSLSRPPGWRSLAAMGFLGALWLIVGLLE